MSHLIRGSIAEFVGTFGLMFVGGGAMIVNQILGSAGPGLVAIAFAHGLILAIMVTATAHISGGQINPSVSIGLFSIGKQSLKQTIAFIVSQVLGSVLAAWLLMVAFNPTHADAVTASKLGATLGSLNLGVGAIFLLEVIATYFLMFAVIGTLVDHRGAGKSTMVGGFAIGLTVAADILCIGPATGASMNPARSFGPALVGGYWDIQWLYWLAPIVGACLASFTWKYGIGLEEQPAS